jgi:hypothetical protein
MKEPFYGHHEKQALCDEESGLAVLPAETSLDSSLRFFNFKYIDEQLFQDSRVNLI